MDRKTQSKEESQGQDFPKDSEHDLSFGADESMFDGSVLDGVLRDFKEGASDGNQNEAGVNATGADDECASVHKQYQSPSLVQEGQSDDNFNNNPFENIGILMFKEQEDRLNTHSKEDRASVGSNPALGSDVPEVKKELFRENTKIAEGPGLFPIKSGLVFLLKRMWTLFLGVFLTIAMTIKSGLFFPLKRMWTLFLGSMEEFYHKNAKSAGGSGTLSNVVVVFKTLLAFFTIYGFVSFWYKLQPVDDGPDEEEKHDHVCAEESFHYAMYHLSAATDEFTHKDGPDIQGSTLGPRASVALIATVFLYHAITSIRQRLSHKPKGKKQQPGQGKGRSKATPKKEPKLKRELKSLDKGDIFGSMYVTELVSPKNGNIASVKRSARVKASSSKIAEMKAEESEVDAVKVDLFEAFSAEPKGIGGGMKAKVKAERM